MSGEFVASPRYTLISQSILPRNSTSASASEFQGQTQFSQDKGKANNIERRTSLETLDSVQKEKEEASSDSPRRKSGVRAALSKAKSKLSPSSKDKEVLPGSEEEYEKMKADAEDMLKRKEAYDRYKLGDKVHFGQGGMQMNG